MSDETEYRYSNLTIYKECKITPDKNFYVNYVQDYLKLLTKTEVEEFQYLRMTLNLQIKIHKTEDFTAMILANNYNYARIEQDNRVYYYFIVNKTQLAQETILLSLQMDVLNTFPCETRYPVAASYSISDRTKVLREHKDRYRIVQKSDESISFPWLISESISGTSDEFSDTLTDSTYFNEKNSNMIKRGEYELIVTKVIDGEGTIISPDNFSVSDSLKIIGTNQAQLSGTITFDEELDLHEAYEIYYSVVIKYPMIARPVVDFYPENINPLLYKEEKGEISIDNNTWYLIYKNKENAQEGEEVVECYLAPKNSVKVSLQGDGNINASSLESGKKYLFLSLYGDYDTTIIWPDSSNVTLGRETGYSVIPQTQEIYDGFYLEKIDSTTFKIQPVQYKAIRGVGGWAWTHSNVGSYYTATGTSQLIASENGVNQFLCYKGDNLPDIPSDWNSFFSRQASVVQELSPFRTFDRTLSTNIKIIELPYLPSTYSYSGGNLVIGSNWEYSVDYGFMKLKDLNTKFENIITSELRNPLSVLQDEELSVSNTDMNTQYYFINWERGDTLEPKILHSEFYQPKFVYDAFTFVFALEKLSSYKDYGEVFTFTFVMTSTIRSRFLFKFQEYEPLYSTEDYDNILSVARNNEVVIYNSAYITYLRTGYNIDIKAKERASKMAITGSIFSGVGSAIGITGAMGAMGLGVLSGNPLMMIGSLVSGTLSIASAISSTTKSVISTINTIKQNEEDMERKLAQLRAQSVSVDGSDDIDLLDYYANNKAKLCLYKVSPRMDEALNNLFYYNGYISNELKEPDLNTRLWFNYIQCELVMESGAIANIPEDIKQEIINKFAGGVYCLHRVKINQLSPTISVYEWNFELDKDNIETAIINAKD